MAVRSAERPASGISPSATRHDSFARRLRAGVIAVAQAEMRKLRRDPAVVLARSINALIWLLVFGTVFNEAGLHFVSDSDYRTYLIPVILAQAGIVIGISVGLGVTWERDAGQLSRTLATPIPHMALVLGKAIGACAQALVQAPVVLIVLIVLHIPMHWTVIGTIAMLAMLMLGTAAFASGAIALALTLGDRERFVGVTQMLVVPLIFVSCALYPLSLMPSGLRVLAELNPFTYEIQAMRDMFLGFGQGSGLWLDFAVVLAFFLAMTFAAARLYPRAIR
jgi:ABC-2 type transport system permease protein